MPEGRYANGGRSGGRRFGPGADRPAAITYTVA